VGEWSFAESDKRAREITMENVLLTAVMGNYACGMTARVFGSACARHLARRRSLTSGALEAQSANGEGPIRSRSPPGRDPEGRRARSAHAFLVFARATRRALLCHGGPAAPLFSQTNIARPAFWN